MTDALTDTIREILEHEETRLSAEAINALHGATAGHPWAEGKSYCKRAWEAFFAISGRDVPASLRHKIERIAQRSHL